MRRCRVVHGPRRARARPNERSLRASLPRSRPPRSILPVRVHQRRAGAGAGGSQSLIGAGAATSTAAGHAIGARRAAAGERTAVRTARRSAGTRARAEFRRTVAGAEHGAAATRAEPGAAATRGPISAATGCETSVATGEPDVHPTLPRSRPSLSVLSGRVHGEAPDALILSLDQQGNGGGVNAGSVSLT